MVEEKNLARAEWEQEIYQKGMAEEREQITAMVLQMDVQSKSQTGFKLRLLEKLQER